MRAVAPLNILSIALRYWLRYRPFRWWTLAVMAATLGMVTAESASPHSSSGSGDVAPETYEHFVDPIDGTQWQIDVAFLDSSWTCIWDGDCQGILEEAAPELGQGCCSVGARMLDDDEARRIEALGLMLDPARFQFHAAAMTGGVFLDSERTATRIVDGACIFLNRPGFDGGEGCALHLAAVDDDDDPMEWKPSVCWQFPLRVEESGDGMRRLRRRRRSDWGSDPLAWCCTEADGGAPELGVTAYRGSVPVSISLRPELEALVGPEIVGQLADRLGA
jgi:hypothetical protein